MGSIFRPNHSTLHCSEPVISGTLDEATFDGSSHYCDPDIAGFSDRTYCESGLASEGGLKFWTDLIT